MRKAKQEISLIDNVILYNLIQRTSTSPAKNKNNFIIYDLSGGQTLLPEFQNVISLDSAAIKQILINPDIEDSAKYAEVMHVLSIEKQDLLSRAKRFFNFIVFEDSDSELLSAFNSVLSSYLETKQTEDNLSQESMLQLYSGQIKIESDVLIKNVEQQLSSISGISEQLEKSLLNWRAAIALHKIFRTTKINEIHIVRNSNQAFFNSYPFMKNYLINLHNAQQPSYPNDVLKNQIYFGNWKHASNEEVINSIDITHVVNMTSEVDNFFASNPKIKYLKINIEDEDSTDIAMHFPETFLFIDNAIKESSSNKVLIHCAQGKSRSGSVTLKYLQDRREVTNPNYGFMEQLKAFESSEFQFVSSNKDNQSTQEGQSNNIPEINNDSNNLNVKAGEQN